MAVYLISTGVNITASPKVTVPVAKNADEEWLSEDITISLSNSNKIAPIVVDFSYDISSNIQYTLDSGTTWVQLNSGIELVGGQSRFIRVSDGDLLNFRASVAGNLNRCIVSIP